MSVVIQAMIAPFAAFFTFIGSMGNIPLAAVLFGQGVAFAGVMAFIFSDLVVFPVLRINAKYYGWKLALYLLLVMYIAIVVSAVGMHYALYFTELLPSSSDAIDPGNRELLQELSIVFKSWVYFTELGFSLFLLAKSKRQ